MTLTAVVAMDEAGLIGAGGGLPWHLPADLARFKRRTWGHPIIMGRRTFESIGRPLPGRTTVVLSRSGWTPPEGVRVATDWPQAEAMAAAEATRLGVDEAFVVGGAAVYALALPRCDRLVVTHVQGRFAGDTFFPAPIDPAVWQATAKEVHAADDKNLHPFRVVTYQRTGGHGVF